MRRRPFLKFEHRHPIEVQGSKKLWRTVSAGRGGAGWQRKKIAAKVKDICEETRIAMRNARRDLNKAGDVARKDGDLTEDDNRALHDEVQGL